MSENRNKNHSSPSRAHWDKSFAEHIQRLGTSYKEVLGRLNIEGLLIHSGTNRYKFLDDQTYAFRANPQFNYWVPLLEHPDCFLWIAPGDRPKLFYYKKTDFWHKMAPDPEGFWTSSFDIHIISDVSEVKEKLGNKLHQGVYLGEWPEQFSDWKMKNHNPDNLLNELHFIRTMKTEYEVLSTREANKKAAKAHVAAKEAFYRGFSEYEINLEYLRALAVNEYDRPYNHIVALNENGAILHYTDGLLTRPAKNQIYSFLIDAGCGVNGYAADITRTYAFHKDGEFSDLLGAMEKMQLKIIRDLKQGVLYADNHLKAHQEISQILIDFGIADMNLEEMVEKKVSRFFFPHGLGHFLGLQVHDVGGYLKDGQGHKNRPPADHPYLRMTSEIREGHIFTIEPGLYFIESLLTELRQSEVSKHINWKKIEGLMKYGGIRIEDNIWVHKDGFENITRDAFALLGE